MDNQLVEFRKCLRQQQPDDFLSSDWLKQDCLQMSKRLLRFGCLRSVPPSRSKANHCRKRFLRNGDKWL
jgi:hypothetical protein